MDFIRKYKKELTIGAGVAAIAAGVVYLLSKKEDEQDKPKFQGTQVKKTLTDEEKNNFEKFENDTADKFSHLTKSKIIEAIKPQKINGRYDIKTIFQIYDAIVEFSKDEFATLILDDRKARRACKNDREYAEVLEKFNTRLEEVLTQTQTKIITQLGISEKDFEESVEKYMEEGNQELFMIHAMLPQRMKMCIPHTKIVDRELFKKIMESQITYLQDNVESFKAFIGFLSSPDHLAVILQNKINDYISETFYVEEEDLVATMKDPATGIMNDPQIQRIMAQVQQATMQVMGRVMGMGGAGGMGGMGGMGMGDMGDMGDMGGMGGMGGNPLAGLF